MEIPELTSLMSRVKPLLNGAGGSCRIVSCRRKMGKLIIDFEVTERPPNQQAHREEQTSHYIGKVYGSDRGSRHFEALSRLWDAGFRPPSNFRVVRPVAYLSDCCLLLQEKAAGHLLEDILVGGPSLAGDALWAVAGWLAQLHTARLTAEPRIEQVRMLVARYGQELASVLRQEDVRLRKLTARALEQLDDRRVARLCPTHGDFHPSNIFVGDVGQVTVIDMDTFGGHEATADVGYLVAQIAIMGYRHCGSFAGTAIARDQFVRAYRLAAPDCAVERITVHVGLTFLQSLFYELCILKTGNVAMAETWLSQAESCLFQGRLDL